MPPKWAQKERSKIQPKQPKGIGSICNLVTACFVRSIASIGHIFLISTLDCDPFEALDSWPPKLQNYIWFSPRKWLEVVPILAQSWCHYVHALCATLLQSAMSNSFQLRIVICLKCLIPNLLSLKIICRLCEETIGR